MDLSSYEAIAPTRTTRVQPHDPAPHGISGGPSTRALGAEVAVGRRGEGTCGSTKCHPGVKSRRFLNQVVSHQKCKLGVGRDLITENFTGKSTLDVRKKNCMDLQIVVEIVSVKAPQNHKDQHGSVQAR